MKVADPKMGAQLFGGVPPHTLDKPMLFVGWQVRGDANAGAASRVGKLQCRIKAGDFGDFGEQGRKPARCHLRKVLTKRPSRHGRALSLSEEGAATRVAAPTRHQEGIEAIERLSRCEGDCSHITNQRAADRRQRHSFRLGSAANPRLVRRCCFKFDVKAGLKVMGGLR
jgi:hypothetical protein